jgi:hypothetical protein
MVAFIWRPNDQYVTHERLIQDSFLLAWSAKWLGEKDVYSGVVTGAEARKANDTRIVKDLAKLIRQADILIAHNGDRFDVPMFNNRLLALGLDPLPPISTIDTCKLAKRHFRLAYNKLDYLGEYLGLGRKIKTDFDLWRSCLAGDEKALSKMVKYNRRDVVLLEQVFDRLRPYVKLPRMQDSEEIGESGCPYCGSMRLVVRGYYRTNAGNFHKWRCQEPRCGKYSRGRKSSDIKLALVPVG